MERSVVAVRPGGGRAVSALCDVTTITFSKHTLGLKSWSKPNK